MTIQSFACPDTESLFTTGRCRRFVNIKSVAERKLAQLDAAPSVSFMKAPPGNDLKEYDGAWHVRINDQWRLPSSGMRAAPTTCLSKTHTDPGPTGIEILNSNGVHHVQERYASCPPR